jgi:hypothetical protein
LKLGTGELALTRDISAAGLYFEVAGQVRMQGHVDFELHLPEYRMRFTSVGEIVRVDQADGKTGFAVRLLSPRLDVVDGDAAPHPGDLPP